MKPIKKSISIDPDIFIKLIELRYYWEELGVKKTLSATIGELLAETFFRDDEEKKRQIILRARKTSKGLLDTDDWLDYNKITSEASNSYSRKKENNE